MHRGAAIASRFPVFRYALTNIARNKRSSATAIVGVVLAITLIAGENISIDSTAHSILKSMLDQVPFDFDVNMNEGSHESVIDALTIANIEQVEVTANMGYLTVGRWGTNNSTSISLFGIRPEAEDHFERILKASTFMFTSVIEGYSGSFNISEGAIMLQDFQAEALGVQAGGTVYLESISYWLNETGYFVEQVFRHNVTVSSVITVEYIEGTEDMGGGGMYFKSDYAFSHIADRDELVQALNLTLGGGIIDGSGGNFGPYGSNFTYYVWADRDKLVLAGDADKTRENYAVTERALRRALVDAGFDRDEFTVETSSVIMMLEGFNFLLMILRLIFLAVSLPAIALGIYLSLISVEVGMTRRSRELGILKARGATSRQIFSLLLTESIILGIIAGIVGLLLGVLTSKIFMSLTPVASFYVNNIFEIYVSTASIILVLVFSIVMILFASYRPAKRVSEQPGVVMLHRHLEGEVKVPYKPARDLIFVTIAISTFALMFVVKSAAFGSFIAFLCILDLLLIVLTPLSTFFLVIGLTRLLTLSTTKLYDKASRAVKFIGKDLWYVVNRNLVRNPRRTSNVCLIIALGLAFGIVVSSFLETQWTYDARNVKSRVGGDILVDASYETNLSLEGNISGVDGVGAVCPAVTLYTNSGLNLVAFNSSEYYDIVRPEQFFFSEGDARGSIEALGTKGSAIINTRLEEAEYLRTGDELDVSPFYPSGATDDLTFEVVAIAKVMPGLESSFGGFTQTQMLYTDLDNLNMTELEWGGLSLRFLVGVKPGYDHGAVADAIRASSPNVTATTVLSEEMAEIQQDPIMGAMYNFLMLIYFFAVLIITVGLGLVVFVSTVERENELSGFIARGASIKQVSSLLMGEGMTITLVGSLIGIFTGLLAGYMVNELISFLFSGLFGVVGFGVAIERSFVASWQTLALVMITLAALVVSGFVAALRVNRINVAKALRERGG